MTTLFRLADFQANIVSGVRTTSGNFALAAGVIDTNGGPPNNVDLVVMDDFIYGDPTATTAATFVSFTARKTERGSKLRWRTAQEVGSVGFNLIAARPNTVSASTGRSCVRTGRSRRPALRLSRHARRVAAASATGCRRSERTARTSGAGLWSSRPRSVT